MHNSGQSLLTSSFTNSWEITGFYLFKMNQLLQVGIRQKALYIPPIALVLEDAELRESTMVLVANLAKLGFGLSETTLRALNRCNPNYHAQVLAQVREVLGVNKNWLPLVKGWDTPTGESGWDHFITWLANIFQVQGTTLACGHIIPANTFPLERYNGCPFCGTPFETNTVLELKSQGSQQRILDLWGDAEAVQFFKDLLGSKTALDATQTDSLKLLLSVYDLPGDANIGMKETRMAVIDGLLFNGQTDRVKTMFSTPHDVLRYLWYKHTGFAQVIEPQTIIKRKESNAKHFFNPLDQSAQAKVSAQTQLKLKYSRQDCLRAASWLNKLELEPAKMCEIMHPKRSMWVRFIRALRLAEYSQRPGFEHLRTTLDLFYREDYPIWQGQVNHFRLRKDREKTLALLKQRPGLFARSLFANMLWFGPEPCLTAFQEVIDQVPARLVFTLNMYAALYFTPGGSRSVKPLGSISKKVPVHPLLAQYNKLQLQEMQMAVEDLCVLAVTKRFAAQATEHRSMYIDPLLFKMPVAIGDRSETVQDLPAALMGTRFPLEGEAVRLFMQWGEGLPAQHLDMDLSCSIAYGNRVEICSYSNLLTPACKHSGDIRSIPEQVGTAEYINIELKVLREMKARYVVFTCNAYSNGSITPNLVVGWMNSAHPMEISESTGVAYDPSCVQHQVRITTGLSKGLIFGVLDVVNQEIVWLEMPFSGQISQNMDHKNVGLLLKKLDSKISIGNLLRIKAEAQHLQLVDRPDQADEVYTQEWGRNTAGVTKLLVD